MPIDFFLLAPMEQLALDARRCLATEYFDIPRRPNRSRGKSPWEPKSDANMSSCPCVKKKKK